jgi:predicted metalloprotease with PDZ domain
MYLQHNLSQESLSMRVFFAFLFPVFAAATLLAQPVPIRIVADLTDSPRKLFHAEIDIPVKAGPVSLITPEWKPEAHVPVGTITNIAGVVFTASGRVLPWTRDDVDMYEYHLIAPPGTTFIHAHIDYIATTHVTRAQSTFAGLEWDDLLLYPAHVPVSSIRIQPSVIVRKGWRVGTSMEPVGDSNGYPKENGTLPAPDGRINYRTTNLEVLMDSPILTGLYFHEYALAPDIKPHHYLDVIGEHPASVVLPPAELDSFNRIVHEAIASYGPPHYTSYHFLFQAPDEGGIGIEHHESSYLGMPARGLAGEQAGLAWADTVGHEFTHSWNGKYRQPIGQTNPDYATPMKNELLWVYEGLTHYMGYVLAARSGFLTPEHFRESLALTAAQMDSTTGRQWRPVEDTAIADSIFVNRWDTPGWSNWRRYTNFYGDGVLIWLDADTTIRKLTHDNRSLSDFFKIFLQKEHSGLPLTIPYDFNEVIADMNRVVKYDWASFFKTRVYDIQPRADLEGIEQSGYQFVYQKTPTSYETAYLKDHSSQPDMFYSIGLAVNVDGTIVDVRRGSAADQAQLAPMEKITTVNGTPFSEDALHAAIRAAVDTSTPIVMEVHNDVTDFIAKVGYHDGEKYPNLVRDEGTPDYLDEIAHPLAKP